MGVPGFFAWLLKNYKNSNIIKTNIENNIDILYLDANCLFHPQCFKVLEHVKNWKDREKLENKMMTRIINYIDYLLNTVNPKKELFISVDGVAPMAKMNQQRKRRFRSIDDNILKDKIKRKHGKDVNENWSNTVITPGTEFMERLNNKILNYIKERKNEINIVYSSYHTPGEGEHKILQDIKSKPKDNKETYIIYGLDADLIFLAMASNRENIFLLREEQHLGKKRTKVKDDFFEYDVLKDVAEELNYVSIDRMKECINDKIVQSINKKNNEILVDMEFNKDFSNDFIFLCYFLGNDFIPHLPSIDIKTGGIDYIFNCYIDTYTLLSENIITFNNNGVKINNIFLEMLMNSMSKSEDYYFKKILPSYKERLSKWKCEYDDPYDRELWNLDKMRYFKVDDPIKLGEGNKEEYKFRYYEHYFGLCENQEKYIDQMCEEFLRGIMWVTKYYFEECPSWEWQNPYPHSPFISDIANYFTRLNYDINSIKIEYKEPIQPFEQLLSVLPPACDRIIPESYRFLVNSYLSPIIDLYPVNIELDMINKDSYWKCIPYIPHVELPRIKNAVDNLHLNEKETYRNKLLSNYKNR